VCSGEEGLAKLASYKEADIIVNALSGYIGLRPSLEAIKANKDLAIANKEALVCGGNLLRKELKKHPVKLMPIDSEHSAIYQCLVGEDKKAVKRLIITASGGPFRDYSLEDLKRVTKKEALKHPTWQMGPKITIDSATLVNKGLEIIEAHVLFDMPYEKIAAVMHYESIIHSMVEFIDGSIKAQLGVPSMEIPIQYALNLGERLVKEDQRLSFDEAFSLHFRPIDQKRFKAVALAYKVGKMGGIMPCVYSVANEVAVKAFLEDKLAFYQIVEVIEKVVKTTKNRPVDSYESLMLVIEECKKQAWEIIEQMKGE
ncbi:1-deoxy-D-xylulose-5-phosphate reductoisomerase, partial [bacterium]|nr:1-deoxy-D-xylulose-5-phosphate reductoisomerase [bacterium]